MTDQIPIVDEPTTDYPIHAAEAAPPAAAVDEGPPDNRPPFERAAEGFDVGVHSYAGEAAPPAGDKHGHARVPGAPGDGTVIHTHPAGFEPHRHGWPAPEEG